MKNTQKPHSQSGFGLLEVLLVLVVLGLVVVAGLLFMNKQSDTKNTSKAATKVAATTKPKATTQTVPMTQYVNSNFSLSYPTDWTVHSRTSLSNNYICLYSPDAVEAPKDWQQGFCGYVTAGASINVIAMSNTAQGKNIETVPACASGDPQQESHVTINGKSASVFDCTHATPTIDALPDYHIITTRIPYDDTTWLDVQYWQAQEGDKRYTDINQQILDSLKLLSPTPQPHTGG